MKKDPIDSSVQKSTLKVSDGSDMDVFYVPSKTGKNSPGIIVLQEAFGVNSHIQDLLQRFSEVGYFAVAPELYHRTRKGFVCGYSEFQLAAPHLAALTPEGMTSDVQACFDWLQKEHSIKNIASVGYCMGGRAAFIANAEVPLKAAISYYGGRIYPDHLPLAKKQKSPLLLFWGGLDTHIPPEQYHAIAKALTEEKKDFCEVVFSQAQHGFSCDERPSFHPKATEQAWALSLQFLKNNLN